MNVHIAHRPECQTAHRFATPFGLNRVLIYAAGESRTHPRCLDLLDDPYYEVWALNAVAPIDTHGRLRADRWFDLHQRIAQSADDLLWIERCPVPIYVPPDLLDAGPRAVAYPLDRIEAAFGGYFTSTFAYQVALALYEGFTTIALFGVDLDVGDMRERTVEFACLNWWLGYAEAKGVTIELPAGSRLGQHPHRYGFEYIAERDDTAQYVRGLAVGDAIRELRRLKKEYVAALPADIQAQLQFSDIEGGIGG